MIDAAEFERRCGVAPERDDLARANCPKAGQTMHWLCGLCAHCGKPRFMCPGTVRTAALESGGHA